MSDFLLDLGRSPRARRIIRRLGLPIPLPEPLRRASGPWQERPLAGEAIVVAHAARSALAEVVATTLAAAGAQALVVGSAEALRAHRDAGEAYGRPPQHLLNGAADALERADAIVLDASGVADAGDLRFLYELCHAFAGKLRRSGRVVVIGRPPLETDSVRRAAAQRALDGFVRALAREVGRKGATAQLVTVTGNAASRLPGVLRWLLSERSAFVSGQPIAVSAEVRAPSENPWVRVLDGKVALVTGAARGIGKATAGLLAAEGAQVVCLDRPADEEPLGQVARDIGGRALLADVTDRDAPERIAAALADRGVDIVVHNAGVTRDKTLARMTPEQWDQVLDINLGAVLRITDALCHGPLNDEGRIVCLSSVAGIAGNMGQTNYAASKAGIIGMVQRLAPLLAPRGITVNAVAPGFIETRLTAAIPTMIREVGRRMSNLGQGGLPSDVGELITFLASPGASGITGSTIRVCGGAWIGA